MRTENNETALAPVQIACSGDAARRAEKILTAVKANNKGIDFILALGATAISDRENVSAAGISPAARRMTARLDAEALLADELDGKVKIHLPTSPAGVTSPVVLTRGCLELIDHQKTIVDCGLFESLDSGELTKIVVKAGSTPAADFSESLALEMSVVEKLFAVGKNLGEARASASDERICVLAECVPGGTTTAMAVLKLLAVETRNLLSGSLVANNSSVKDQLTEAAIRRLQGTTGLGREMLEKTSQNNPLLAVSYAGDPMQAFCLGFIDGYLRGTPDRPLILGGGSQMLAVYALAKFLFASHKDLAICKQLTERVAVITTQWVAYDPHADTRQLAAHLGAPYIASCPDFHRSRHSGLRAYEEGHVKEGVGAGAAMALALQRFSADEVRDAIDRAYEEMTGR